MTAQKRGAEIHRKTRETDIRLHLELDGQGKADVQTGIGFFDHLLEAWAKHSGMNLTLKATGDLHIDGHHTVEDVGIVLGQAFHQACGEKRGINRFGHAYCPLDEALARAVVDLSGRPFCAFHGAFSPRMVGDFDSELWPEFLRAFATQARITLHIELLYGENMHHACESMVKALARALSMAIRFDENSSDIPSTKGTLS
ncbi:imidazoleglycerol-phosphate dehydratase HisB [candidate division KSB1 bacterium]|nr:imidazoleglycerol-phosphate dehydratase HisB [candidate division KSB1 bacterium]